MEYRSLTELRIKTREKRYRIPDVCVYTLPAPEERFPSRMPVLWIEILSLDDKIVDVWSKASDLIEVGVPNIWIVNPTTLESELRTPAGLSGVPDKTLRLQDSPIVIPLLDVMAE
jgi:Uma2 family endonuclease